jgi:hypothetical protein
MPAQDSAPPPSLDIPELELPARTARRSSAAAPEAPARAAAPSRDLELDDEFSIERTAGASRAMNVSLEPLDDDFGPDAHLVGLLAMDLDVAPPRVTGEGGRLRKPTGKTPEPYEIELHSEEIAELSGYGAVPAFAPLSVPYAVRVALRRRELTRVLEAVSKQVLAAETARDEALAQVARDRRAAVESDSRFQSLLAAARRAEAELGQERTRLGHLTTQASQWEAELARQRDEISELIARERARLTDAERTLEARRVDLERVQARVKRVQIELRNARAQASAANPNAPVPQFPDLEARLASLEPELVPVRTAHDAAASEAQAARQSALQAERGLAAFDAEAAERARQQNAEQTELAQRSGALEREVTGSWADVARAVLATELGDRLEPAVAKQLLAHDDEVWKAARALELHLRALDAYDHDRTRLGHVLIAVLAFALLLLFGWLWAVLTA